MTSKAPLDIVLEAVKEHDKDVCAEHVVIGHCTVLLPYVCHVHVTCNQHFTSTHYSVRLMLQELSTKQA